MELGALLKQARLDAGLSQRQLCGNRITRNMLSQIEHGTARPSMETLLFLADRLGKPVSYFLQENSASPNQPHILQARAAWSKNDAAGALAHLDNLAPDEVFDAEANLLRVLCCHTLAQTAINDGRLPYGKTLLEKAAAAGAATPYYTPELKRQHLLLVAQTDPGYAADIANALPDDELLLRAKAAYQSGAYLRSAALLDAAANQTSAQWNLLRGNVYYALEDYANAREHFLKAEDQALPQLEACCEKLGDYKMAYYYACKQR